MEALRRFARPAAVGHLRLAPKVDAQQRRYAQYDATNHPRALDLNSQIIRPENAQGENKLRNMIFMHGLLGSSSNWRGLASSISTQCLVNSHLVDARNHGASPHSDVMDYDAMSEDLHKYILKNDLGRVILLGHSMGGKWAINFATTYPELVEKIIVVDIAPVTYHGYTGVSNILEWMYHADITRLKSRKEADKFAQNAIPDPLTYAPACNRAVGRGFVLQNLIPDPNGQQEFIWRNNVVALYKSLPNIMTKGHEPGNRFYGPALYVKGTKSPYVQIKHEQEIHYVTPSAQIVAIEGAGHYVHAEKPKEFLASVIPFIVQ